MLPRYASLRAISCVSHLDLVRPYDQSYPRGARATAIGILGAGVQGRHAPRNPRGARDENLRFGCFLIKGMTLTERLNRARI